MRKFLLLIGLLFAIIGNAQVIKGNSGFKSKLQNGIVGFGIDFFI